MDYITFIRNFLEIRREQWIDRDVLDKIVEKRLEKIIHQASKTKHYAALIDSGPKNLDEIPLTNKLNIQKSQDSFVVDPNTIPSLTKLRTSGSSGEPLEILADKNSINYRTALRRAVESFCGLSPFDSYMEITIRDLPRDPILSNH